MGSGIKTENFRISREFYGVCGEGRTPNETKEARSETGKPQMDGRHSRTSDPRTEQVAVPESWGSVVHEPCLDYKST